MNVAQLPVLIIGAGPIGLAAAAHLLRNGETPLVLEAGASAGTSVRKWSHVRVFSPWQYNVDSAARELLEDSGWTMPNPEAYPTGGELVDLYLAPLAALPEIAPHIRLGARVVSVTRYGFDKMKTTGREDAPFLTRVHLADGSEEDVMARAVIDASGTYETPNPLGASGLPARGERAASDRIFCGIPDALGAHRERYAARRVLVIGGGHSAFNALTDLVELARETPETKITWAVRRDLDRQMFGGGEDDQLPERGNLGRRVERLVDGEAVRLVTGFRVASIERADDGIVVSSESASLPAVDEIVAATGFRPDLGLLSELRLSLDPALESPTTLAPLIDPNLHSCGTVRPHGAEELQHPERDFYIVGMKSYGRAPTFLMLTGYEQIRSVVAAIRGDWESARRVELTLPETGVCSLGQSPSDGAACCSTATAGAPLEIARAVSCCGSPEPALAGAGARSCCA